MKKLFIVCIGLLILNPVQLIAGDKEDLIKQILANNEYSKKNNQAADEYSSKGALEFWSSGGLLQRLLHSQHRRMLLDESRCHGRSGTYRWRCAQRDGLTR